MKKLVILIVFIFAVSTLTSCRSKKNSCDYSKIEMQELQPDVEIACVEVE